MQASINRKSMADENKSAKDTNPGSEKFVAQHKEHDDQGYFFYPERNNDPANKSQMKEALFSWNVEQGTRCKYLIQKCTQKSESVKFMLNAMKIHGCPVNLDKHISCERCKMKISGGFDFYRNQVVVCQNNVKNTKACCNTLAHELLHAFDHCRSKFDVTNPYHVACTEIRAANLFHCTYTNAVVTGEASPIRIAARHQDCVKTKALASVMLVQSVTREEGKEIVEKVFDKCYNDLEPFGRRLRPNTQDIKKAVDESALFGYGYS